MKRRVSLTIDPAVAAGADQQVATGAARNRSAYIEEALRNHLERIASERAADERRAAWDADSRISTSDDLSPDQQAEA